VDWAVEPELKNSEVKKVSYVGGVVESKILKRMHQMKNDQSKVAGAGFIPNADVSKFLAASSRTSSILSNILLAILLSLLLFLSSVNEVSGRLLFLK
jgi:hypothetical protein